MLFEDKEANIIESLQLEDYESIFLFPESIEIKEIINTIKDRDIWHSEWVDSSAKKDPPPDFYNEKKKIMMEVMRIDDHAYEKDGKFINPTNQRIREVEKELRNGGFLDAFPNAQLFINAPTDLPKESDHNYTFYKENFKRIIEKHKKKIKLYRKNHPDFKLIFLVFDESSMYCDVKDSNKKSDQNEPVMCQPHIWPADKAFIDVIIDSEIDYFIWYTPYKPFTRFYPPLPLPSVCIFDCKRISHDLYQYNDTYMVSAEN